MIHLEITQSPDHNVQSQYKYFQNQIYLGRTTGDLWIEDKELFTSHVMLEVINKELLIHPQKGVDFYLINGKRASAIRKLKTNDQITIGKTQFKIMGFGETTKTSKKDLLDRKLSQLIQENSPRLDIIEKITKMMKS